MRESMPEPDRTSPTARDLEALAESRRYSDAVELLNDVDLTGELPADFAYYAAVCLGWTGQTQPAIALLKRAAGKGPSPFWCACHLGWFETNQQRAADAACYFTVALILEPERVEIDAELRSVAPQLDLRSLQAAQAQIRSAEKARIAFDLGDAAAAAGRPGPAAHYFTTALALDPAMEEARAALLRWAPGISTAVLESMDRGPAGNARDNGGVAGGASPSDSRSLLRWQLRDLANAGKYAEAVALLGDADIADADADVAYYAGVCLGWAGKLTRAVALLKRAAILGAHPFWCACHLGWFEANRERRAQAACYLSVALIIEPGRMELYRSLQQTAAGIDLRYLNAAQAGLWSAATAADVGRLGADLAAENPAGAAHYLTAAIALEPAHSAAWSRLLELVPDACLAVLDAMDKRRAAEALRAELNATVWEQLDIQEQLSLASRVHATYTRTWHESGLGLRGALEGVLRRALAAPDVSLDPLCQLYDTLYFLYFYMGEHNNAMRGFLDGVARPFADAVRDGYICRALPSVPARPLGHAPLRIAYLSQWARLGPGNGVGPYAHYILQALKRYFPQSYWLTLYAWNEYDEKSLAPLEAAGIPVRRFAADSMSERLAMVQEAIAADTIDILITDQNSWLPTVLFERRVAPVQIYFMVGGLSFWPLQNIDGVFRIDVYDPALDGFTVDRCFPLGLGPWYLAELAPSVDPARIAAERARLPQAPRLAGTYARLAKITPEFLSIAEELLIRHSDLAIVIGGYGQGNWIREFIEQRGLAGRLEIIEGTVDGHVWGHVLEIFLDTFPTEGGVACREVMAKGRPVVRMNGPWSGVEAVPMLVARDRDAYIDIVSRLLTDPRCYEEACRETRNFVSSGMSEADYAAAIDDALTTITRRIREASAIEAVRQTGAATT